jgi:hypothetical protein
MSEQNKNDRSIGPDFQFMQTSDEPEFASIGKIAGFDFYVGKPSLHDWYNGEGGIRRPDYSVYFSTSKNLKYSNVPVGLPNELTSTGVCEFLKKWELSYIPAWQQDAIGHYIGRDDLKEPQEPAAPDRDYFNEWTSIVTIDLPLKRQPQDLEREVVKTSSVDWTDWKIENEVHVHPDVKDFAQRILDSQVSNQNNLCPEIVEPGITMKSNVTITRPKIVETTAPIPAELLMDTGELKYFVINYSQSFYKGNEFLTYLFKLMEHFGAHADVTFDLPLKYEEYSEVMKAYMESPNIVESPALHTLMAELLLFHIRHDYGRSPYATVVSEVSFLHRFIDENKDTIGKWEHFIDSTQVLALSLIKPLRDHYDPKNYFEKQDTDYNLSPNIAKLFAVPDFIVYYFSIQGRPYRLSYFTKEFEQPIFNENKIGTYFRSRNNYAALMFEKLAEGYFKASDVGIGIFGIGVFAPGANLIEYDATDKY